MKEKLVEIVKFLTSNTNYTKAQVIMIINPLKTEEQAIELLNWIEKQKPMNWYHMRVKARQIAKN